MANGWLRRAYTILLTGGLLLPVLLCTGCSARTSLQITHLKGRLAWGRQDWNNAIVHFFSAETQANDMDDPILSGYADFALGSVYLMQNEDSAASEKFSAVLHSKNPVLQAQSLYQKGIIAFRNEDYSGAAALFKQSLEVSGTDIDAKINYELSRQLCIRENEAGTVPPHGAAEDTQIVPPEDSIVLNIIRKKEELEWKKMQDEAAPAVNDY